MASDLATGTHLCWRAYLAAYFALVGWITFYWHWALESPKLFGIHLTLAGLLCLSFGSFHTATFISDVFSPWLPAEYSPWSLIGQFAGSMPTVQAVLWHTILLLVQVLPDSSSVHVHILQLQLTNRASVASIATVWVRYFGTFV